MAGNAATRFFGGSPLMVIFRLVLLSILVGVVLRVLGLDPLNILRSVEDLIRYVWNMGFDAVVWLWRYFLLGAVIVIPIWLIVRLCARRRGGRLACLRSLLLRSCVMPRACHSIAFFHPSSERLHAGFQDPEAGVARAHLLPAASSRSSPASSWRSSPWSSSTRSSWPAIELVERLQAGPAIPGAGNAAGRVRLDPDRSLSSWNSITRSPSR